QTSKKSVVHGPHGCALLEPMFNHLSYDLADEQIHDSFIEILNVTEQAAENEHLATYGGISVGLQGMIGIQNPINHRLALCQQFEALSTQIVWVHRVSLSNLHRGINRQDFIKTFKRIDPV